MKKEIKKEVEDALEILNGLITNYNDFFLNDNKPIPDDIKNTYLNLAKTFMNDLKEEDLKEYQKSSSYEDLVGKYNILKDNVAEAETKIKEHNEKALINIKTKKLSSIGEISSDRSLEEDIINMPSEELLLASSFDDKLKYVSDKINFAVTNENIRENEILVLTYTNKDSKNYLSTLGRYPNIKVMPVNKFICTLGKVSDNNISLNKVVSDGLTNNLNNDVYTRNLVLYLLHYHQSTYSSLSFNNEDDYNNYLDSLDLKTLKGESVCAPAIINITDFLTENMVDYKTKRIYEDNQIFNVLSLRDDLDVIYFEIDEKGNPPEFLGDKYRNAIDKIRSDYESSKIKLVECYAYEKKNGSIINSLYAKLFEAGIKFVPEKSSVLFDLLVNKYPNLISALNETIQVTIKEMIEEGKNPSDYNDTVSKRKLSELIKPIYDKYNVSNDFAMQTYKIIDSLPDNLSYKFIIIDNFEEITTSKFKLIQKLKEITSAKLLFLGDDWQSVYLNSGTNPKYIKNVKKYYPDIKITYFPSIVVSDSLIVSKYIISKTNNYYEKNIIDDNFKESFLGIVKANNKDEVKDAILNKIDSLPIGNITIVGRYLNDNPNLSNNNVKFMLTNDAKNLDTDYTFIINTEKGLCGYPSEILNNAILNDIIEIEPAIYNDYRALANVIRNTKKKVYLIVNEENISMLFKDITEHFSDIIQNDKNECPLCGSNLVIKPVDDGEVLACSNKGCNYEGKLD